MKEGYHMTVITRGDLEWLHLQSHSLSHSLFPQTLTERCLCARLQGPTSLIGSHLAPASVWDPSSSPDVASCLVSSRSVRGAQSLDQAAATDLHAAARMEAAWLLPQACSSCSVSLTPQHGSPSFILRPGPCFLHAVPTKGVIWQKPMKALRASQVALGEGIHLQCERCGFNPWVGKIPWRRRRQPTPVFLPGESYGQRSLLAGNNPEVLI